MAWPIGLEPPPRGEDLPCDDGRALESERHRAQINVLVDSLDEAWRDRDDFFVAGNMGLYFSETQARRNDFRAPDVFVVMEADRRERKRWVVWEEDGRTPDMVIEIVSPSTEAIDRGEKMRVYAQLLRVWTYVIYDPFTGQMDAYALEADRRYRPVPPDEHGRVGCGLLDLRIGPWSGTLKRIEARWLRWFTPEGEMLLEPREQLAEARWEIARLKGG